MHFLITGHTGFKGSWMIAVLHSLGHQVSGIALDPEGQSLFQKAGLERLLESDLRIDIRESEKLDRAIKEINPDVVIHLAAQSQVLESYRKPKATFETNVNGTLNLLNSTRHLDKLKAILIVTTDKVYKNIGQVKKYNEMDELGGTDPYSASKAMADILTQSWYQSFSTVPIGIARAGNVIGGGDYSLERIIPNLIESISNSRDPELRNPKSIRPWQHVLDCIAGYLELVEHLIQSNQSGVWNFGPSEDVIRPVEELANFVISIIDPDRKWVQSPNQTPHEELYLLIDSAKARTKLNWSEKYDFEKSVSQTVQWYLKENGSNSLQLMQEEISEFQEINRK